MSVFQKFLSWYIFILTLFILPCQSVFAEKKLLLPRQGRVKDIASNRRVLADVFVWGQKVSIRVDQNEIGLAKFEVQKNYLFTGAKSVLYVHELYNLDRDHYQRVGKLLLRVLVNLSFQLGCEGRVQLGAAGSSHAFYLKYGFIPTGGNEFGRPAREKWIPYSEGDRWNELLKLYYRENRSGVEEEKQIRQEAYQLIASILNQPMESIDFDSYWPPVQSLADEVLEYAKKNNNKTGLNERMEGYGGMRLELTPKGLNRFKQAFLKMNLYSD